MTKDRLSEADLRAVLVSTDESNVSRVYKDDTKRVSSRAPKGVTIAHIMAAWNAGLIAEGRTYRSRGRTVTMMVLTPAGKAALHPEDKHDRG